MSVMQLSSGLEILLVEADFPGSDALTVFRHWTEPELLVRWWPQQAELQPIAGGAYHLSWPQMGWHLRGRYTSFEPGQQLAFSWQWDHTLEGGEKNVRLRFEPLEPGGTRLILNHGPYLVTEEGQKLRIDDHLAGWLHFLPRLQHLLASSNTP